MAKIFTSKLIHRHIGLRCILSSVFIVGMSVACFAKYLSPEQALQRLKNSSMARKAPARGADLQLVGSPDMLYIYQSPEGFMVLPADDSSPALLGWCDNGSYSPGENPQFDYWLESYTRQIKYNASHTGNSPVNASPRRAEQEDRPAIEPLVKTKWNQEYPYNTLCPKVDGHETVTGCVATAMSQIIRTHQHPYRPTGKHSYNWHATYRGVTEDSTLSIDYDTLTFDFNNMPYVYDKASTEVQKKAVAQLMVACGVSVNMGYNIGDSGASTMRMGTSLMEYFKYDASIWMPSRNYYGLEEWQDMIYADLAKGLPVLYAGDGTGGGHQFICDGYIGNGYFHFNWGWGGMSDGYFLLDALNPNSLGVGGGAGGFNFNQQIALNVTPATEGSHRTYLVYCGGFTTKDTNPVADEYATFEGRYFNYSLHTLPADTYYGIEIVSSSNDTTYIQGSRAMELPPLYGEDSFRVKWPALADGTYKVSPVLKDVYGNWLPINSPLDSHGYYTATVVDGKTTLSQEPLPQAVATGLSLDSKLYVDSKCGVSFTITNRGDAEYIWKVAPALLDSAGNIVAEASPLEVDLAAGKSREVSNYIVSFSPVASAAGSEVVPLQPGNYTLTVINTANRQILTAESEELPVTLEEKPSSTTIEVTDFKVNDGEEITEGSSAEFRFLLTCREGYIDKDIYIFIFKDGERYDVKSHTFAPPLLSAGESKTESALIDLSPLAPGRYRAYVYYGDRFDGPAADFTIKAPIVTGVSDINADSSRALIFDLNGCRLKEMPRGKPCIVNGKVVIIR